jgi:hypothetical protein
MLPRRMARRGSMAVGQAGGPMRQAAAATGTYSGWAALVRRTGPVLRISIFFMDFPLIGWQVIPLLDNWRTVA